jgi:hypothetical protein
MPDDDSRAILINKLKKQSWHFVYYSIQ